MDVFAGPPAQEQDGGQHIIRNERLQTVYSYSLFHGTLCLANMYVTMQLTQWIQPQETTIISFSKSWSTVILKTISTWSVTIDPHFFDLNTIEVLLVLLQTMSEEVLCANH